MKKIVLAIILLQTIVAFSQTTIDHFSSAKLSAKRDITVKLPASYNSSPDRFYPMVLVSDSELYLALLKETYHTEDTGMICQR